MAIEGFYNLIFLTSQEAPLLAKSMAGDHIHNKW